MDIIVIAHFITEFEKDSTSRFIYICNELAKSHSVELITSDFSHFEKNHRGPLNTEFPFKITFLHESGYNKNISLKRFSSHYFFGKNLKKYLNKRKKPDVIYSAVPSLTAPLSAAKYCKKNNIRFIIDIQDFWPEAFKMVFRIPIISDLIFAPFSYMAKGIYKRADSVVAVSNTYVKRALAVNKNCTDGKTVFIGTRLESFDEGAKGEPVYAKSNDEIWLGYCGSLAASYDIPTLFHAMRKLYDKGYSNVKAIIMGDGAHRQQFEAIAEELKINVIFTGKLPYNKMCAQLTECDIAVNPIKAGSAASIINKHGDYAASGLPVVNSQDSKEYRHLIDNYSMGLNSINNDPSDMADKLETLISDHTLRVSMGENARRCATEKFDRKTTYNEIINLFE